MHTTRIVYPRGGFGQASVVSRRWDRLGRLLFRLGVLAFALTFVAALVLLTD